MLHIITNAELSDKNKDVLNEFNTYYNSWIDSCINNLTFMEMQSKLLCLPSFLIFSIVLNNPFSSLRFLFHFGRIIL